MVKQIVVSNIVKKDGTVVYFSRKAKSSSYILWLVCWLLTRKLPLMFNDNVTYSSFYQSLT